ncbi:MAG: hypothetical protein LIP18_05725, partial [Planctomycetes bacterium]|nr:hypothetical protein [Planctomycetota bacterium]
QIPFISRMGASFRAFSKESPPSSSEGYAGTPEDVNAEAVGAVRTIGKRGAGKRYGSQLNRWQKQCVVSTLRCCLEYGIRSGDSVANLVSPYTNYHRMKVSQTKNFNILTFFID